MRAVCFALALAVTAWPVALALGADEAAAKPGTIKGTVYEKGTKKKLAGAKVVLVEGHHDTVKDIAEVKTNAKGEYVLENVKPGKYQVFADADGHVQETHKNVEVAAGGEVTRDFYLWKLATD